MIVITHNGRTTVYRGWRAWLLGAGAFVMAWLALALLAFVLIGIATTVGVVLLLAVPALIIVTLLSALTSRPAR